MSLRSQPKPSAAVRGDRRRGQAEQPTCPGYPADQTCQDRADLGRLQGDGAGSRPWEPPPSARLVAWPRWPGAWPGVGDQLVLLSSGLVGLVGPALCGGL